MDTSKRMAPKQTLATLTEDLTKYPPRTTAPASSGRFSLQRFNLRVPKRVNASMSIKQQVDDAQFLHKNGRHLGSLTLLLIAVGGSSRRVFPADTPSRTPTKSRPNMGDAEAYKLFLDSRLRDMRISISLPYGGKQVDIVTVLYKYMRCALAHQSELPNDIEFSRSEKETERNQWTLNIEGHRLVLSHGWIALLTDLIVFSRCNAKEFGIKHFDLIPTDGLDDEALTLQLASEYGVDKSALPYLKRAILELTPEAVLSSDDDALRASFISVRESAHLIGAPLMMTKIIAGHDFKLTPMGLSLLRSMAGKYQQVELS
jgi:hypothetical protein